MLQREVKDARIGMVTVTDVEVTRDLRHATVHVNVTGDDERKSEALKGLSSAAGFLRSRLGRELTIRRVPELRFKLDRTHEHAARISELLAEVKNSDEHGDGEDTH